LQHFSLRFVHYLAGFTLPVFSCLHYSSCIPFTVCPPSHPTRSQYHTVYFLYNFICFTFVPSCHTLVLPFPLLRILRTQTYLVPALCACHDSTHNVIPSLAAPDSGAAPLYSAFSRRLAITLSSRILLYGSRAIRAAYHWYRALAALYFISPPRHMLNERSLCCRSRHCLDGWRRRQNVATRLTVTRGSPCSRSRAISLSAVRYAYALYRAIYHNLVAETSHTFVPAGAACCRHLCSRRRTYSAYHSRQW